LYNHKYCYILLLFKHKHLHMNCFTHHNIETLGHKRFVLAGGAPASDLVPAQIISVLAVVRPPA
jgi:hypothetical protein